MSSPATPIALFWLFCRIGVLSFGGGAATVLMMERELVVRRGWMTAPDFSFTFAISKTSPGINILAHTMLIGHALCGTAGLVAATLGLMLPAATMTVLLTWLLVLVRDHPLATAALSGALPATAGMSLALAWSMGLPQFRRRRGSRLARAAAILLGSFLALYWLGLPAPLVLAAAALAGFIAPP